MKSVFFGTPDISVYFLEKLKELGFSFDLIVTNPDKPIGRKQVLTPSPVKKWVLQNGVDFLTPEKIDDDFMEELERRGGAAPQKK